MDWSFDESQSAVRELAGQILGDGKGWAELCAAGLVGLPWSGDAGFLEAALVAEQVGRHTAEVPFIWSVAAGMAIAEFGSEAQRGAWLDRIADGSATVTCALASPTGSCVPWGVEADAIVAATREGGLVLTTARSSTPLLTTSGLPEADVELDDGEPLAGGSADWLRERATALLCMTMAGVCQRAVELTAEYTTTRQQFDKPIASFQAVGQRAADAYVDTQAVTLTALQAAWRLSEDQPAEREVAIAKFWSSDGGQRVVHAAQHLHGGMGVDRSYPLHRYFLWAKHLELTLGGATEQLRRRGAALASGV